MNFGSAEGAKYEVATKNIVIALPSTSFRAFSAKELQPVPPGPMAQAFTFRAVGAEARSFNTGSVAMGFQSD